MMGGEKQSLKTLQGQAERIALIVEDDQIVVVLLEHLLSRQGFTVQTARDGMQATALIENLPTPPTLILLDVMLPYLDGFELIEKIRRRAAWNEVPIIMLTAKSQGQHIVRALDGGASDYVVKPFRPEELMARIRRLLSRPAAR